MVGATYGITLIKELFSQGRGGYHFIRLIVDKDSYHGDAPFNVFHEESVRSRSGYTFTANNNEKYAFGGSSFKKVKIDKDSSSVTFNFNELYKPVRGLVPLPPHMYFDKNGRVKKRV